jgi:hypothetical protein
MSNLLLPIPTCAYIKNRGPADDGVNVDRAASGKETRSTCYLTPIYTYSVNIESLNSLTRLDYQALATFFQRHQGRLQSFLIEDPEDKTVTDHGFAVADGIASSFQIQRTVGGSILDAAVVTYNAATKPYTNLVKNSSFETDSNADGLADSWSAYNGSPSTEPNTTLIVPGLNGGKAQRIAWGTNNTTQKGVFQATGTAPLPGQWYTISFFARASGSNVGKFVGLAFNVNPSTRVGMTTPALTTSFQRYVIQVIWNVGLAPDGVWFLSLSSQSGGLLGVSASFGDLDFDLVQVTSGQWGANDLQPVETPVAATGTDTPAYWPSMGDGYEPITELNGTPTIYEDGTWRGRRQLYPYLRTNLLEFSEQFDNAAWSKTNATITANATTAPDGTSTADQFNEGAVATVQHFIIGARASAETQGELCCYSVFVKANTLPNIVIETSGSNFGVRFNLSTGIIDGTQVAPVASGVITDPRWPGWYRVWYVARVGASLGSLLIAAAADGTYNLTYTGTSRTFYAWGAMAERVSNANGPTPYIPTPGSAAVAVLDYTLSATGVFTPASVPVAGTVYSWDGSYYRRVRLANPGLKFERIVASMWSVDGLELVSVK